MVKRVRPAPLVLIPKNGLGNRLRAIAGGLATARAMGRDLEVLWEPYDGSATLPSDLFDDPLGFAFLTADVARDRGIVSHDLPKYLDSRPGIVSLRGYDRGQQTLLAEFMALAAQHPEREAVVAAGNYFHPDAQSDVEIETKTRPVRQELSRRLVFNPRVKALARANRPPRPYLSVHLRGSDRRKEVPSPHRLLRLATSLSRKNRITDIFLCSDSEEIRSRATEELHARGFQIFMEPQSPIRRDVDGEIRAGADFVNLQGSEIIVGAKESTFVTEAAVLHPSTKAKLLTRRTTGSSRLDRYLRRRFGDSARMW